MILIRYFILILISGLSIFCASSQNIEVNKMLLKTIDDKAYSENGYVVIYDSTIVDVKETGLSYVTMHKLTKILNASGAKDCRTLSYTFDTLSAYLEFKVARIYRKDGKVETVDKKQIYDYPAPARMIYWGGREQMVDFGRLEPGDAVETIVFRKGFTYALLQNPVDDDKYIPPMKGHFYDIVEFFSVAAPIKEKTYCLYMPQDKLLQYQVYNGDVQSYIKFSSDNDKIIPLVVNPEAKSKTLADNASSKDKINRSGKTLYCWTKKNIMPVKKETNMVDNLDVMPKLLVSTTKDWYAKAAWFNKVNEDFGSFDVTPEVKKKTDELLKGVTDETQKISILTHWVAEAIRYSGISMGRGEGYTLHKGCMTYTDKCGVCKDKAGMLVTMLRAAGFESYPAMTMAGSHIDRIPADQFNHSVTVVKRKSGEWVLLDPTWVPGVRELWSSAEQQQEFLMGIPGGADLKSTPISPPENHYWKLVGITKLLDNGTLEGTLTVEAEGQTDAFLRRAFSRTFSSSWEDYFPKLLYAVSPKTKIIEQNFSNPDDISKPFKYTVKYSIPDYAVITKDIIYFVPICARNPFSDKYNSGELYIDTSFAKRQYGFKTRCSKLVDITETITLPKYSKTLNVPVFNKKDGKFSSFESVYSTSGNVMTFHSVHSMGKRIWEAQDWPEFKAALTERFKTTDAPVILAK